MAVESKAEQPAERPRQRFRVAIVGGGLGGLALAQMLRSNERVQVTVYERQVEVTDRLAGYRIQMEREAIAMLTNRVSARVGKKLERSIGEQPASGQQLGFMRAERRDKMLMTWYPPKLRSMVSVNRWIMRQALLDGADGFLRVGKKLVRYDRADGADGPIKLFFADQTTATCDLLVGADGVHSAVRRQLLPDVRVHNSCYGVTYFKVPYVPETAALLPFGTGVAAFCGRNQVITLHAWINPARRWSEQPAGLDTLDVEQSFIMLGFGSDLRHYRNQTRDAEALSSEELRDEIRSRLADQTVDPLFRQLVDRVALDSAYSNILKLVEEPRPWSDGAVTLLGDATLNMSPYTGKGASLAVANALELAKCLDQDDFLDCPERRRTLLNGYVKTMIKRRRKQRKAGVFVQRLVFSGKNSVKVVLRDSLFRIVNVAGHSMDGVRRVVGSNRSLTSSLKIEPV